MIPRLKLLVKLVKLIEINMLEIPHMILMIAKSKFVVKAGQVLAKDTELYRFIILQKKNLEALFLNLRSKHVFSTKLQN